MAIRKSKQILNENLPNENRESIALEQRNNYSKFKPSFKYTFKIIWLEISNIILNNNKFIYNMNHVHL